MGLRKRKPQSLVYYEEGGAVRPQSKGGHEALEMYEAAEASANLASGANNKAVPNGCRNENAVSGLGHRSAASCSWKNSSELKTTVRVTPS